MRAVIHVGPHKTGTTSFQIACGRASDQLLRAGIMYPSKGLSGAESDFVCGHADIARAIGAGQLSDAQDHLEAWKAEALGCGADILLLSSEDFSSLVWEPGDFRALDALLADTFLSYTYVVVLRRIRDSFPSYLRQLVTHFGVDLFDEANLSDKLEAIAVVLSRLLQASGPRARTVGFDDLRHGCLAWNLLRFCIDDDSRLTGVELDEVKENSTADFSGNLFELFCPLLRALVSVNQGAANPYSSTVQQELDRLFLSDKAREVLRSETMVGEIRELVSSGLKQISGQVINRQFNRLADQFPDLTALGIFD